MKATVRLSTLAFAAGLAFQPALAEDRYEETLNTRQYVGGFASYVDVDEDRQFDDEGLGYSAFYGRQLSDRVWWETEGGFYKVDPNQADFQDFYQYHLTTGLAYAFGDRTGFTPYVIAAVGAIGAAIAGEENGVERAARGAARTPSR